MRYAILALLLLPACGSDATQSNPQGSQHAFVWPSVEYESIDEPLTVVVDESVATEPEPEPVTTEPEPEPVVVEASNMSKCDEWADAAVDAGWDQSDLYRLGYILWRESRCQPDAHNASDPNSGSYGLTQINGFWCRPSKYNASGYLQSQNILTDCDDLYEPTINLLAARAIYDYGADRGNCPWGPWTTRNTNWCSRR